MPKSATLAEAIKCIDASALQVALVLEASGELAGVLTDGDVRRALLRGVEMGALVLEAMNPNPTTALTGTPREKLLAEMRRLSVRHLPLTDGTGVVVGLTTLNELIGITRRENRVVLMAGGLGSRLSPLTDDCPKPMLAVGNKPLLQTILENFVAEGFHRFSFSVNYLADRVREHFGDGSAWGVEIDYILETKPLGTAGSLGLLNNMPEEPVVVMNGDLLTKVSLAQMLDFHAHYGAVATMGVREYEFQVPYGVVETEAHRISRIEEKPVQRFFVNAGLYVLSPEALALIPPDTFFDMPSLFSSLVERGSETAAFPIREYWLDIGHIADYHRANGEFSEVFS